MLLHPRGLPSRGLRARSSFLAIFMLSACATGESEQATVGGARAALVEDGLAVPFARFEQEFRALGRDLHFDLGLAPFPALGTENLGIAPLILDFAQVDGVPSGSFDVRTGEGFALPAKLGFELWAGRNGPNGSIRADANDTFVFLGTLTPGDHTFASAGVNLRDTDTLDFFALTRVGTPPEEGVVALANLSLFEKRFWAAQLGWTLTGTSGVPSAAVPSNDPQIQRGFALFFGETFGGNGRTCGSCHRAENNFTIDPAFVATLPASDPLLSAARKIPGLEGNRADRPLGLVKDFGLILENLDGPSSPVFRSVQHTLGMSATTTRQRVPILAEQEVSSPPDERTGWSGDGSPGRGTLHDFTVGAISQHLTTDLRRRAGKDFRLPTQAELDALEAFQLSLGRDADIDLRALTFRDTAVENGKTLFNTQGLCFVCHSNAGARSQGPAIFNNVNLDQGVERRPETLARGLPPDAGFGKQARFSDDGRFLGFGDGEFNVQSLIEAADTAPFFHNNSAQTIEDAVRHYTTAAFDPGPAGFSAETRPTLDSQQVLDVAALLRVLNASENVREVRERLVYVRDNRSAANTQLLQLALADIQDALDDLNQPGRRLSTQAYQALVTLQQIVRQTLAQPENARSPYADIALRWCTTFVNAVFTANPNNEFLGQ
jgi:cytochrome c peroxidase